MSCQVKRALGQATVHAMVLAPFPPSKILANHTSPTEPLVNYAISGVLSCFAVASSSSLSTLFSLCFLEQGSGGFGVVQARCKVRVVWCRHLPVPGVVWCRWSNGSRGLGGLAQAWCSGAMEGFGDARGGGGGDEGSTERVARR